MIFVHGKKRVERNLGKVADFCPICRDLRAFDLVRVGIAGHVYFVSMGEGTLAGHLIKCRVCGTAQAVNVGKYADTEKGRVSDPEALIQKTYPGLRAAQAERLALEAQIKQSPAALPPERREALLMEPFVLLNPMVEKRFASSSEFDRQSGLGCLGTMVIPGVVCGLAYFFHGSMQDKVLAAAGVLFAMGIIYTFLQLHLGPARYVQQRIGPLLASGLRPLDPTRDELARSLERSKTLGLKIGKVMKPDRLYEQLRTGPRLSNPAR